MWKKKKAPQKKGVQVIVYTDETLTTKARKDFKKNHPGYRLCFSLRYPNFPLVISSIALAVSVIMLIVKIVIG